jgi:chloramphenicol 3-O-phosphotransferase
MRPAPAGTSTTATGTRERRVFVLSGAQAAGKSTVAALLAGRSPRGVHVAGDNIRAMVVSGKVDMAPDGGAEARRQLLLRYRASIAVAKIYHDDGFDVVIEDVIIGEMLEQFLELLPWSEVHLVVLNPDADELARRERLRGKNAYGTVWSVAALARILNEETPRLGKWLDSSHQAPEQTVDAILADLDLSVVRRPGT